MVRFVPPHRLWEIKLRLRQVRPDAAGRLQDQRKRFRPTSWRSSTSSVSSRTRKSTSRPTRSPAACAAQGIGNGSRVAILCRNSRWFALAFVATLKLGADGLLLNTAFAGPQLVQVIEDQNADAVIMDEEYYPDARRTLSATSPRSSVGSTAPRTAAPQLESLRAGQSTEEPPAPERTGRTIILTSGTTGKPKGAARAEPKGLEGPARRSRDHSVPPWRPHARQRAALPRLGLLQLHRKRDDGRHRSAASPLRPGRRTAHDRA